MKNSVFDSLEVKATSGPTFMYFFFRTAPFCVSTVFVLSLFGGLSFLEGLGLALVFGAVTSFFIALGLLCARAFVDDGTVTLRPNEPAKHDETAAPLLEVGAELLTPGGGLIVGVGTHIAEGVRELGGPPIELGLTQPESLSSEARLANERSVK